MKIIKLSEEKRKRKKKQRASAELHEVLPTLKLFKDKKPKKKESIKKNLKFSRYQIVMRTTTL